MNVLCLKRQVSTHFSQNELNISDFERNHKLPKLPFYLLLFSIYYLTSPKRIQRTVDNMVWKGCAKYLESSSYS